MHDAILLRWMTAGSMFLAAVTAILIAAGGVTPPGTIPATPRFQCLCLDSIPSSGPRSLSGERN